MQMPRQNRRVLTHVLFLVIVGLWFLTMEQLFNVYSSLRSAIWHQTAYMIGAVDYNTSKWSNEMWEFLRDMKEIWYGRSTGIKINMVSNENGIWMGIDRREWEGIHGTSDLCSVVSTGSWHTAFRSTLWTIKVCPFNFYNKFRSLNIVKIFAEK